MSGSWLHYKINQLQHQQVRPGRNNQSLTTSTSQDPDYIINLITYVYLNDKLWSGINLNLITYYTDKSGSWLCYKLNLLPYWQSRSWLNYKLNIYYNDSLNLWNYTHHPPPTPKKKSSLQESLFYSKSITVSINRWNRHTRTINSRWYVFSYVE